MAATVAIGYFMGDTINAQIDKVLPASIATGTGVMGYLPTVAEAGIGAMLLKSKGSSLVKSAAGGILLGAGLRRGLKKAGVVAGYQSVPALGGYQSVPALGRASSPLPNQLTGKLPEQLTGYRVNGGYRPNGSRVMGGVDAGSRAGISNDGSGLMN